MPACLGVFTCTRYSTSSRLETVTLVPTKTCLVCGLGAAESCLQLPVLILIRVRATAPTSGDECCEKDTDRESG
ncbi:hypothetical protein ACFL5O_08065 [Myxococcota bacterium]